MKPDPSIKAPLVPLDPELDISRFSDYRVIKRDGKLGPFDPNRIVIAVVKAFLATEGRPSATNKEPSVPARIYNAANQLTKQIIKALNRRMEYSGGRVHIEDIQDQVELELMRSGEHKVARAYVLYREEHAHQRAEQQRSRTSALQVTMPDGTPHPLDETRLYDIVAESCRDIEDVSPELIVADSLKNMFEGIPEAEVNRVLVMSARMHIEKEPNYSRVAARLLLDALRTEALHFIGGLPSVVTAAEMETLYLDYFPRYIRAGIEHELLDSALQEFDLEKLARALVPARDMQFTYLGLRTLYDRYFLHWDDTRFELPQAFFMRVAMGLSLNEIEREERAIEFYRLLSSFDFMSSTPTLFNSGTLRSQLSSCYLTTVPDDLSGIYNAIKDNALLSKFAGGLGNDWTRVRAMGSHIKGTNGKSQGVVPFLKVANDTLVAVNQCFAGDTPVYTADGARPIKSIRVGDLVLGQRGEYREVKEHLTYLVKDEMVSITVKHAIEPLKVTSGHPFWAIRGVPMEQGIQRTQDWLAKGKVKADWVDAGQLQKGDYVAQVIPKEVLPVEGFDEDDARLYGIMLGDGHCSKDGLEWGVSANPERDTHLQFVQDYLTRRGVHFWFADERQNYRQIRWASGYGVVKDATNGRIVGAGAPTLPFSHADLYNAEGKKYIAPRFSHLPPQQTLALVQGLVETDGGVSRGAEIYFTNTSQALIDGLRYQCLRLGVPVAGQYREREQDHSGRRANDDEIHFNGLCKTYDLRIPAVPRLAERLGCKPLGKFNWFEHHGCLFTRVRQVEPCEPEAVIHDLKVEGDETYMTTAALVHNGGRRKGSGCAYLETWHLDIEEFLELRKNTGDDRRRTHDMNTANWIPDLFMKRVHADAEWTLFSPSEAPDLHDRFGADFEAAYLAYEDKAARGEMKLSKKVSAVQLWRKMLTMLFETGHPWVTFKDPCNLRSPQQHVGVVHSSNLCTEITLNTSDDEIAVCNLGSINLAAHIGTQGLDLDKLARTVNTAMRMLDNVIDINYYSVPQARRSNLQHRPVGMGLMGFQDALYLQRIPYASDEAVQFADNAMEAISYYAIQASSDLAAERGSYKTFQGSLWSQGILPIDSLQKLAEQRGEYLTVDTQHSLDWDSLRQKVMRDGMRNSNCMAIAPTATISNICGVTQSIEPTYQNLFVKSNLSGEFTVVNPHLVADLKAQGLWDDVMVNDLKYYDGSVQNIDRVPRELKALYATAFELDPSWLVEAAARRQKWIDQAQSLNLYMREPSGKRLDNLYKLAWLRGLKTTYYLRTLSATHVEKTTVQGGMGQQQSLGVALDSQQSLPKACAIDDPECEACQ